MIVFFTVEAGNSITTIIYRYTFSVTLFIVQVYAFIYIYMYILTGLCSVRWSPCTHKLVVVRTLSYTVA